MPFRAKLKQAIPACPAVIFYPVTDMPIKALGNYIIQIKLHKDVTAELTVKVVEK